MKRNAVFSILLIFQVCFWSGIAFSGTPGGTGAMTPQEKQANAELEDMAKEIAALCNHPGFLGFLRSEIVKSKNREQIIELDNFLDRAAKQQGMPAQAAATAAKVKKAKASHKSMKLTGLEGFDLYIPVEAHRAKWKGGKDFIIAVSPYGDDQSIQSTVGYSVSDGKKVTLSAKQPPNQVVMVIAPEEHESHEIPVSPRKTPEMNHPHDENPKPDAGNSEEHNSYFSMSYLKIYRDGESWLRGDPEVYLLAGQICNGQAKGYYFNLARVNKVNTWYYIADLNSMYFDGNCSNDTFYAVWEADGGQRGVYAYATNAVKVIPTINCYPDKTCSYKYVQNLWRGNGDDPIHDYIPAVHTNKMLGYWNTHNYDSRYSDSRYAAAKFYKRH